MKPACKKETYPEMKNQIDNNVTPDKIQKLRF